MLAPAAVKSRGMIDRMAVRQCRRLMTMLIVAAAVMICASAEAAAKKRKPTQVIRRAPAKVCYTYISGSASPQPCERARGAARTTAIPTVVIRYR